MTSPQPSSDTGVYRRRGVLAGVASAGLFVGGAGATPQVEGEVPRTVIVPSVSEFEGNFAGQFLTIYEAAKEGDANPSAVHDACQDMPWPADVTESKVGQLTDRRADTPVAVRVPVYVDGRETDLVEDALFVINRATQCEGDHAQLDVEWVTTRSLVGKPAGPTVEGDEAGAAEETPAGETTGRDGPGFGPVAGLLAMTAALLWRALRRGDD